MVTDHHVQLRYIAILGKENSVSIDTSHLSKGPLFRLASGVLSNIDHQTKNPNIDQISTTQHFIDQISTAKFP